MCAPPTGHQNLACDFGSGRLHSLSRHLCWAKEHCWSLLQFFIRTAIPSSRNHVSLLPPSCPAHWILPGQKLLFSGLPSLKQPSQAYSISCLMCLFGHHSPLIWFHDLFPFDVDELINWPECKVSFGRDRYYPESLWFQIFHAKEEESINLFISGSVIFVWIK